MTRGMEHLRRAEALLANGFPTRQAVKAAAEAFWAAAFEFGEWPTPLEPNAYAVQELIFARGPIERTVDQMDDAELQQTKQELAAFVKAALQRAG